MQNLTHSSYPVVRLFLQISDKFAEMKNDGSLDFPIGRHSWEFSHGFCGRERHKEHSLTLSQCVKNSEFTCDDGTCIVINKVTQAEREMEVWWPCHSVYDAKGTDQALTNYPRLIKLPMKVSTYKLSKSITKCMCGYLGPNFECLTKWVTYNLCTTITALSTMEISNAN